MQLLSDPQRANETVGSTIMAMKGQKELVKSHFCSEGATRHFIEDESY